MKVGVSL